MAGNVAEWTADIYKENYYGTSPPKDPKGPEDGPGVIVRGGSWVDGPGQLYSARRQWMQVETGRWDVGFRCDMSLQ